MYKKQALVTLIEQLRRYDGAQTPLLPSLVARYTISYCI